MNDQNAPYRALRHHRSQRLLAWREPSLGGAVVSAWRSPSISVGVRGHVKAGAAKTSNHRDRGLLRARPPRPPDRCAGAEQSDEYASPHGGGLGPRATAYHIIVEFRVVRTVKLGINGSVRSGNGVDEVWRRPVLSVFFAPAALNLRLAGCTTTD